MKQFKLVGEGIKLIIKDNILAVLSDSSLTTVSSAFHNGGFQKTNVLINAQVPKEYNDGHLHQDPEQFIQRCLCSRLGNHQALRWHEMDRIICVFRLGEWYLGKFSNRYFRGW